MRDPRHANKPTAAFFTVSQSMSNEPIENEGQFVLKQLYYIPQINTSTFRSNKDIKIDELDGYEIIANGQDYVSNIPIVVYQVMLFDGDSYYLMQGLVGRHLADEYLLEFKAMAESFERTR